MDSSAYFFDLLKIILPALIVAGAIYFLFQQFLEKEQQRRLIEMRLESSKTTLPLRLQALERVTMLLERITPNNLLVRVSSAGLSAADYHRLLLQEVRAEVEHNLSQQLYMQPETWAAVKQAQETVVNLISTHYQALPNHQEARGPELARHILEGLMTNQFDPTAAALLAVKREAVAMF
ncbi:hypothetical protein MUN84_16685 [Hymenobacter sp. 5516J-16]|uniref:LemA family protein n=1 Tax=Hymenobacter sublimis TaxID=2933777 RepID=A0ABY4JBN5_9BACT|nr:MULTISPECIES: hypothetical protein [Hymenobacter]UOQ76210.1 hypothetical protein MUN84_16685 [Hymenobacter sp. 5516J-16]UPL49876.1 hypothetical protein MWH26_02925 [Hymenobacter sublimis]